MSSYEWIICPHCSGSGEGMYEGTRCHACQGKGEIPGYVEEDEEDEE